MNAGGLFRKTLQQRPKHSLGEFDIEALAKARFLCEAALDNKAEGVVIMDMRAASSFTDYFVIASAYSTKRVQAIAGGCEEALRKHDIRAGHIEGEREALWVLIDYGDVVAHVFYNEMREFYNLERLWRDAPRECFSAQCTQVKSKRI